MGLLEDAIREHLDLKRLRGADPAEVAREQHEALEPPHESLEPPVGEEHAEWTEQIEAAPPVAGEHLPAAAEPTAEPAPEDGHAASEHAPAPPAPQAREDLQHMGEETAELDMRAFLGEEQAAGGGQDSLEWEMPSRPVGEGGASAGAEHAGAGAEDGPGAHGEAGKTPEDHSPAPGQGRLSL